MKSVSSRCQFLNRQPLAGRRTRLASAISAALFASSASVPAVAQTLEEVFVTATKRSETVQEVPLAITALSGDFVAKTNLDDIKDLVSYTPGVTGNSQDSFLDAISVRGIRTQDFGIGGDPSAAFFKNDLYEGRNGSAVTTLYDMDRAEILRGPQGFLFGRSSVGGAFSVHTRRAEVGGGQSGYLSLDVGERERVALDGAINVPVSDGFAMRFAGMYSEEDGFVDNNFERSDDLGQHEKWGLRWSTALESDNLTVNTMVEYEDREVAGSLYRAVDTGDIWDAFDANLGGVELAGDDEEIDSDLGRGSTDEAQVLTLGVRVDYDLGFATLTSNTGYKDHDYFYREDYDGTALKINNYGQDQEGDYFQQELRITSNGESPLEWYAGASYYREEIDTAFTFEGEEDLFCQYYGNYAYPGYDFTGCEDLYAYYGYDFTPNPQGLLTESGRIKGEYTGWAAYVNVAYGITEHLEVEVGARYAKDNKDFSLNVPTPDSDLGPYFGYGFSTDGFIQAQDSWDDVTGRVLVRWRPTDDGMLYASFTQGFKSGGFGSFAAALADGTPPEYQQTDISTEQGYRPTTFDEETVDSFEIGYKDSFLDGAANYDVTVFYYEYQDLQIVFFEGGAAKVENVGEVEAFGIESSVTAALGENFTLYLAASYLDSEANEVQLVCDDPDDENACEGSELFWAPDFTAAAVLDGRFPHGDGAFTSSFEVFWEDERGGGWAGLEETKIKDAAIAALRIGYESSDFWAVELYVENLFDEFKWDGQNNNGEVIPAHFFGPQRGRTIGARINASWD